VNAPTGGGARLHDPAGRLTEASQHLARVEALLELAAMDLGKPLAEPVRYMAAEVERLRRRVQNARMVATGEAAS
jgi:hypothetical protein